MDNVWNLVQDLIDELAGIAMANTDTALMRKVEQFKERAELLQEVQA